MSRKTSRLGQAQRLEVEAEESAVLGTRRKPATGCSDVGLAGKDELNLAEFPIALVTDKMPSGLKTLRFEDRIFDERRGQVVRRKLVITAADEYGLPTAKDDDVILGLIQLTRIANGFTDRSVRFSRSDLIRLLRWPDTGPSYRRLTLSFHRWLGVSLHYENAWWDRSQQKWSTVGFHILETFQLADSAPGRGGASGEESVYSRFVWNEEIFRSFQAGYLKQLDLDFYLGLKHPTAKRIYRFLDKRFFHRSTWEFDLKEFAFDHIGLSRSYEGATQIARKLGPALAELEEKGFLEGMGPEERYRKVTASLWRIRLSKKGAGVEPVGELEAAGARSSASGRLAEADPVRVADLVARGVNESTARALASEFDAQRIAEKVEVFDWLVRRKDRKVSRNPAGYLVRSIRDDYAAPAGFEPESERARRAEEVRRAEQEKAEAEAEAQAREAARLARVRAYWEGLPLSTRENLESEALRSGNPAFLRRYRAAMASGDLSLAESYKKLLVEQTIEERLGESERAGRGAS